MGTSTNTKWWERLAAAYESGAAAAFILHGNVRDYVRPGVSLGVYLASRLGGRDILAFYNPASGFRFPFQSHEDRARKILEAADPRPAAPTALQGLLGAPQAQPPRFPREPAEALAFIDALLRTTMRKKDLGVAGGDAMIETAVIVEYSETIWPAGPMSALERRLLAQALEWGRKGDPRELRNFLILIAEDREALAPALLRVEGGFKSIHVPKPNEEDRLEFIQSALELRRSELEIEASLTERQLARKTAGLSLMQIEDIILEVQDRGAPLTSEAVIAAKDELINQEYGGLVEILEPHPDGFKALGGKEALKNWLRQRVVEPIMEGRVNDAPKGVVFVGPPGTGKTYAVRCLAAEIGFNAIVLDAGRVQAQYVGQTQERLRRVFELADTLAPVLIFMDEVDQSDLAQRGQGSGNPVAADMFNMMLRFLGDERNRGKVLFVGATNRPDLMDAALKRSGRMDAIVPFLAPDAEERAIIAAVQARLQGGSITESAIKALLPRTENWSGADIEALIRKARFACAERTRRRSVEINEVDIEAALNEMRPDTSAVEFYTALAVRATTEISLLPERWQRATQEEIAAAAAPEKAPDAAASTRRGGRRL